MPPVDRLLNLLLVKRDELGTLALLGGNLFIATLALIVLQIAMPKAARVSAGEVAGCIPAASRRQHPAALNRGAGTS